MGDTKNPRQSSSDDAPEPISDNTRRDVAVNCEGNGRYEAIRTREAATVNAMPKPQSTTSNGINRWRSNNGHGCSDLDESTGRVHGARDAEKYPFFGFVGWRPRPLLPT